MPVSFGFCCCLNHQMVWVKTKAIIKLNPVWGWKLGNSLLKQKQVVLECSLEVSCEEGMQIFSLKTVTDSCGLLNQAVIKIITISSFISICLSSIYLNHMYPSFFLFFLNCDGKAISFTERSFVVRESGILLVCLCVCVCLCEYVCVVILRVVLNKDILQFQLKCDFTCTPFKNSSVV